MLVIPRVNAMVRVRVKFFGSELGFLVAALHIIIATSHQGPAALASGDQPCSRSRVRVGFSAGGAVLSLRSIFYSSISQTAIFMANCKLGRYC